MNAAIYARYSSDNQREESIEAQIRAIKEYASKNDYQIVKIYTDEAKSATTDNRPAFLQMIKDSELGLFQALIVHKLDRFSRDRYDSAFYKRALKKNGVRLISVLENLDDSPESIILESVLEGMAEYYSKNLAREVMKGMKETAFECKHTGGVPPLGYDVTPEKKYSINEHESEIVKQIFDMYLKGYGYGKIAENLNNSGCKTKVNGTFSKNSIYGILINEKYMGTFVFNKRSSKINGKRNDHAFKDDSEIIRIPNAMPVIIDSISFKKVQDKIHSKKRGPRMDKKRFYLLTGYLYCGKCGASYTGNGYVGGRNGQKYIIYSCVNKKRNKICDNKSIRQDIIENHVIDEMEKNIFSEKAIKNITNKLLKHIEESKKENNLDELKNKVKDINLKLNKLVDALLDDTLDKSTIKEKRISLESQKSFYETKLKELELRNYDWINDKLIKNYILTYKGYIESNDNILKRKAIDAFVHKIIIYPDKIETNFKVSLNSDKVSGGEGN